MNLPRELLKHKFGYTEEEVDAATTNFMTECYPDAVAIDSERHFLHLIWLEWMMKWEEQRKEFYT